MPIPQRGFTLIELLVVISIIAVLAGMLLPALGLVRNQARQAVCAGNLRQVSQAVLAYTDDNDGRPPFVNNLLGAPYAGYYPLWHTQVAELLDILVTNAGNGYLAAAGPFLCPQDQIPWATVPPLRNTTSYSWALSAQNLPMSRWLRCSASMLLMDSYCANVHNPWQNTVVQAPAWEPGRLALIARHGGKGLYVVFGDGHVAFTTPNPMAANIPPVLAAPYDARLFWAPAGN